ncbi:MAG: sugar ABC transporter substrate-binding protein, partial [Clostridiales bacterium]|nr:sugar ABC transporter substrate-binding protein [Clostridiales bacterium]
PADFHVAYAAVTTSLAPWVIALAKNFEEMCKAKGWKYSIYDGMGDVTTQTEQINSIISDGEADLVILFPADSEVGVTYVQQFKDANIPVITLGSDVKEAGQANVKCYVGPNQREMVDYMSDYVIKKLGTTDEQNVVCISGWQAQYDYIVREDEMKKKFEAAPNYKILATEYAGASRADAKTIMEKFLVAYPDIDVVFCMSDEFALGAIVALEAANKLDKVTIVSLEGFQEGFDAIKAGKMDMTVTMTAANVISKLGEVIEPVMTGAKVDYLQYSKVEAVTKENVANFKGEY